jgi:hypothetical protein
MFVLPSRFTELILEHRHADGSWASLERSDHGPADHDPEREWGEHGVYVCSACNEQVRVSVPAGSDDPDPAG